MDASIIKAGIEQLLIEGRKKIGNSNLNTNCSNFIREIYKTAGLEIDLSTELFFNEIYKKDSIGKVIFLKRKNTNSIKNITHMGIIFPDNMILHYSRWMNGNPGSYTVFLSSFEEIFEIYNFVEKE